MLRTLAARLKSIRVFTLGIDQAVNAAFLKRLADLGGGTSELVESEERLDDVMDRVHRHIGTPVLTGLRLEPAGLCLHSGQRDAVAPAGPVRGDAADDPGPLPRPGGRRRRLAGARRRPAACGPRRSTARREPSPVAGGGVGARPAARPGGPLRHRPTAPELEKEITDLSLRFGVLCRFTAFVAVDRSEVVNAGGQVHSIVQPVEQPQGWAHGVRRAVVQALARRRCRPAWCDGCGAGGVELKTGDSVLTEEARSMLRRLVHSPRQCDQNRSASGAEPAAPECRSAASLRSKAPACCNACSACSAARRTRRRRRRPSTASRTVGGWPTRSR